MFVTVRRYLVERESPLHAVQNCTRPPPPDTTFLCSAAGLQLPSTQLTTRKEQQLLKPELSAHQQWGGVPNLC